jgi:hypothetical protein
MRHEIHVITHRRLPGFDQEHYLIDIRLPVERLEGCRITADIQPTHVVLCHHVSPHWRCNR